MTEKETKPFEIIVGEAGGEIVNGDVPVRWCITPALVADMEAAEIHDPHILLISYIKGTNQEMDRKLVPITEIMTYVRFTRAGEHTLASWIINGGDGSPKNRIRLKNTFLKDRQDLTHWDANADSGYGELPDTVIKGSYTHCHISINIPAGAFAKEPPKWLKWFGNVWHPNRVKDQCNFRQRLILAFTLKWIPMLFFVIGVTLLKAVLAVVFTACGWYKSPQYKHFLHPFDSSFGWFIDSEEIKIDDHPFLIKKVWDDGWPGVKQTFLVTIPLIPIFPLILFTVVSLVAGIETGAMATSFILGLAMGLAAVWDTIVAIACYLGTSHIGTKIGKAIGGAWHRFDMKLANNGSWPYVLMALGVSIVGLILYVFISSWLVQVALLALGSLFALFYGMFWLGERFMDRQVEKNDYTQIRELLCPKDPENVVAEYKYVPPKQRTVHLWVSNVKNKICKPMQY